jgi:MFS transporter, AAHS family, 4-hydroxybenzoate transporter
VAGIGSPESGAAAGEIHAMTATNIAPFLDAGAWTGYRKLVVAVIALAVIFDGFEIQILSFVIPQLIIEWGVTKAAFGLPLALGLIGMTIGSTVAGALGDRIGRRRVLIGSVLGFGVLTVAVAWVNTLTQLNLLRFVSGVALGGALPSAAAYASEFTPARNRVVAVTMTIVCVPVGGMLGGLLASFVLPLAGWRTLFVIAGLLPLAFSAILYLFLPESPRFLVRNPASAPVLARLLVRMGMAGAGAGPFVDTAEDRLVRSDYRELLAPSFRRDTLALWLSFFFTMVCVYIVFGWVPTLLAEAGFDIAFASRGLALFNMGGVFGAVGAALLITRLGSRRVMLSLALLGMLTGAAIFLQPLEPANAASTILLLTMLGLAINGVQTTMFALASHVYPAPIRGTGVGSAISVGRTGAILISYLGATILTVGGASLFFGLIVMALAGVAMALLAIRNHVRPATDSAPARAI